MMIQLDDHSKKAAEKLIGDAPAKAVKRDAEILDMHDARKVMKKRRRWRITQKLIDYANSLEW